MVIRNCNQTIHPFTSKSEIDKLEKFVVACSKVNLLENEILRKSFDTLSSVAKRQIISLSKRIVYQPELASFYKKEIIKVINHEKKVMRTEK